VKLLRKGRRKRVSIATFAVSLVAYMGLSVVGAAPAFAQTCNFSSGIWTVTLPNDGDYVYIYQEPAGDVIFVDPNGVGGTCTGSTSIVSNTTAINVTGGPGDQWVGIYMYDAAGETYSWGSINWTISLGDDIDADFLWIDNSGGDDALDMGFGANGIDLNGDDDVDISPSGIEAFEVDASTGDFDDTITGAGGGNLGGPFTGKLGPETSASQGTFGGIFAGDGDDTLTGGSGNDTIEGEDADDTIAGGLGDDILDGGEGAGSGSNIDTVTYAGAAAGVIANLDAAFATGGDGLDTLVGVTTTPSNNSFERLVGTDSTDTLTGDDQANRITPSGGNDTVDGEDGEVDGTADTAAPINHTEPLCDVVSYSDLAGGVEVDLGAETATGTEAGDDTLSDIEGVRGSTGDDTLADEVDSDNCLSGLDGNDTFNMGGDGSTYDVDTFDGGSGTDAVDYSAKTENLEVWLGAVAAGNTDAVCSGEVANGECDIIAPDTVEKAWLGSGDDIFSGSRFNNVVYPGGGQNVLNGDDPNVPGSAGGIDTVNYKNRETGVTVNLSGGGPATNADSASNFENGVGSPQADTILGSEGSNSLKGGKGADTLSGNGGADFIDGGAGNDSGRGGAGDDTMKGGDGKDNMRGGGGDDDINGGKGKDTCAGGGGFDHVKCEKVKGPKNGRAQARVSQARLHRVLAIRP
jgi:Ca2+-binding RTX toxin-like protein